jgi:predicted AAA+ superfamily ATPase
MKRYLEEEITKDLQKKMVFLSGPRQCGKTTLAKQIMASYPTSLYLNWDSTLGKRAILKEEIDESANLIVFDEIHKFRNWKNKVKGLFDTRLAHQSFLVTGSARLDVYRRGGDSLMGRYHHWRLHPITPDEIVDKISPQEVVERIMLLGGFPEPFLQNDEREARRWRLERSEKVIKEDIRDLEAVRDISRLNLLLELLRERVGSPISINNLAEEIQVSHKTIQHWIEVLERMYIIFRVYPFSNKISRSLQKQSKIYFFDVADGVEDLGSRSENLLACALLKRLQFLSDRDGFRYELCYIRDKEKREVDFAVVRNGLVLDLIECKYARAESHKSLQYFGSKLAVSNLWQLSVKFQPLSIIRGVAHLSIGEAFALNVLQSLPEKCSSILSSTLRER